ncbi:MAG: T9SS type A sorting domain-containing protein [Paludibacter sp.]|nr:T9SS type A sorting domain-containing protein [Paludibacter sp.]
MKRKVFILVISLCLFSLYTMAQVAMGKWRTHFAYNSVIQIAQSKNKIYAVSEGALYSVDKQDGNLEFYSKLSGLNGTTISRIEYDNLNDQLLIIYTNGNIDLLGNGGVINVPDLYNKQMSASKEVNQINFYDNKAYLSCNFGVVVLNMQKKEVADTYFIGNNASEVKVLGTAVVNGVIYALSQSTVYKAPVADSHLVNYEFWSTMSGLPGSGNLQALGSFAGKLFIQRGGKLYKQDETGWTSFLAEINVSYFNISNGKMLVSNGSNSVYVVDELLNSSIVNSIGSVPDLEYEPENDIYWFAANDLGVISVKQNGNQDPSINYYKPIGPAVNIPWSMTFAGKKLFVVPGGRWAAQYGRSGSVMIYENGVWSNILEKSVQDSTKHSALDFMNVAVDPIDNKHFFIPSYGTGLYEFKNDVFVKWYNSTNSILETVIPSNPNNYTRLDGAVYDQQGNLFVANSSVSASIKVLLANGQWTQLKYSGANKETLGKILIDNQNPNRKWVASVRGGEIIIFDDNGTVADQSDDKSVVYSSYPDPDNPGGPSLAPGTCYTLAQDKNGVVWMGTDQGPFLFHNPSKAFDSGFGCSKVKIPRNDSTGLADYLLVNERVKAIAIDGANRKWIGTEASGVYLMSENGQQTIQHFTVSNSPLLSNDIISIAINPVTGEVFFGTGQGIVSYQSDASEAGTDFGNVYAYPNPVRQGFTGVITITGLVENTQVKITDLNGNLVCQTISNGSIATWDGKDVHGRKVNTGIYMAICLNADGTKNAITKILVIN